MIWHPIATVFRPAVTSEEYRRLLKHYGKGPGQKVSINAWPSGSSLTSLSTSGFLKHVLLADYLPDALCPKIFQQPGDRGIGTRPYTVSVGKATTSPDFMSSDASKMEFSSCCKSTIFSTLVFNCKFPLPRCS